MTVVGAPLNHVRFAHESRHVQRTSRCPLFPRKRTFAARVVCPLWAKSGHCDVRARGGTSGLPFNNSARAKNDRKQDHRLRLLPRRAAKKIQCHIVNCETKRHDCAYSTAGGGHDYHSRTGVRSFGISSRSAHGSPLWLTDPELIEIVEPAKDLLSTVSAIVTRFIITSSIRFW